MYNVRQLRANGKHDLAVLCVAYADLRPLCHGHMELSSSTLSRRRKMFFNSASMIAHGVFSVPVFAAKLLAEISTRDGGERILWRKQTMWICRWHSPLALNDFESRDDSGERWWERAARKRRARRQRGFALACSTDIMTPVGWIFLRLRHTTAVGCCCCCRRRWPMSYRDSVLRGMRVKTELFWLDSTS